jgi:hypothetical protein
MSARAPFTAVLEQVVVVRLNAAAAGVDRSPPSGTRLPRCAPSQHTGRARLRLASITGAGQRKWHGSADQQRLMLGCGC